MSMSLNRTQIAAKIEAAEGTAEALTNAEAFLAFRQGDPQPDVKMAERDPFRDTLSQLPALATMRSAKFPFQVELAGSGTAGTAPFWGKLLKACGFAETITPGTSVVYAPASTAIPSMTLAAYMDGVIFKTWGARGNLKISGQIDKPIVMPLEYQGADFSQLDGAMLANVNYSNIIPPPFIGGTFTLDGVPFLINKFDIDLANVLALRSDPNSASGNKSCLITGRKPKITLDPEMMLASTKDIWTMWKNGTTGALSIVLGATAGNIVTIAIPKFQIQDVKFGERTSLRTNSITALLAMDDGDDEITITLT